MPKKSPASAKKRAREAQAASGSSSSSSSSSDSDSSSSDSDDEPLSKRGGGNATPTAKKPAARKAATPKDKAAKAKDKPAGTRLPRLVCDGARQAWNPTCLV